MARIFITGSADGLGQLSANALIKLGHQVVLHARSEERAQHALKQVPGAEDVLIADLSSIEETKALASKANALGIFDVVIHNAGVYQVPRNSVGAEGLPTILAVNSLAPYILTCLMHKPERLIYLSSGMHLQGDPGLDNLPADIHSRGNHVTYSDTKLHDVILSMAVARRYKSIFSNAVDPGWVPTRMGGAGAPDNLEKGFETQVWLAVSNDPKACVSGQYFHHKRHAHYLPAADDVAVQEKFLVRCKQITQVGFDEEKA
ncbi:SDR family NAD(P)-dependent oxidoreductase [Chitinophaga sp. CF418]|uniref:SDR family NAD(P)-dependent oxidoreductase n=1 Tax=Chitinophaga sp. CF418 TaxID=1855287 RepID=UPI0009224A3F|nr:SDR family NAD(P)-dependent oxidoreductase [Chitinophaga sp. CF418]SHN33183.1 NAD(P)-dependent dehydrogenase, short-chain alcohol dehydrogenase family [Chitinophaga sp. CF418]